MLWLTWRQHRMQVLLTTALLAVLGVVLLISGLGAADFAAQNAPATDCVTDTPACSSYIVGMNELIRPVGELLGGLVLAGIVTPWLAAFDVPPTTLTTST
ncbi:hypothetical protein ACGFNP_26920 [Nonomuraea sp. NPDC049269]|uniref:hypothetical protein n=1 Tax=Nonomuraea sp. NPDC049269 TaxID=3364349 RepID=UPI00371F23FC